MPSGKKKKHPKSKPSPRRERDALEKLLKVVAWYTDSDYEKLDEDLRELFIDVLDRWFDEATPTTLDWTAALVTIGSLDPEVPEGVSSMVLPILSDAFAQDRPLGPRDAYAFLEEVDARRDEALQYFSEELLRLAAMLWTPGTPLSQALESARLILEEHDG